MKLLKEFKEFALKGNVMDMAVGVIIGGAFSSIVTALTTCFINPLISSIGGAEVAGVIKLPWVEYDLIESPEEKLALCLNYGGFITAVINFLILAVILFIMLKTINAATKAAEAAAAKLKKDKEEEEAPTTKICPFCKSEIDIEATKCPHCTSDQPAEQPTE